MMVFIYIKQERLGQQPGMQSADLVFSSLPESYKVGGAVRGPFTATDHRGDAWHVEGAILTENRGCGIYAGVAVGEVVRIEKADEPIIVKGGA